MHWRAEGSACSLAGAIGSPQVTHRPSLGGAAAWRRT